MRIKQLGLAAAAVAVIALLAVGWVALAGPDVEDGVGAMTAEQSPERSGTATLLQYQASEHVDPQRMSVRRDLADYGRLVYRSLVAFPTSTDPAVANSPVPDLATDTGAHNADATVWSFTLKTGVLWQDGKPITCGDLKYGVSRVFATDVITGGPTHVIDYLDIPTTRRGRSVYTGPYHSSAAGRRAFDRAVTCHGRTITYHFKKSWPELPQAIAGLAMFDPYRADQDTADRHGEKVFSNGPYLIRGKQDQEKELTFVRNPEWDPTTDPIREAYPDQWVFKIGIDPERQYQQLIADQLPDAITTNVIPPTDYPQITGPVQRRSVRVNSPFTEFVLPRFTSAVMRNHWVRLALAQATDRQGWIDAFGGPDAAQASYSVINPGVSGYRKNPTFTHIPLAGAPATAYATLTRSGLKLPVHIKLSYPGGTPESEAAAMALKRTWDKVGFDVVLDETPDTDIIYTVIERPRFETDLVYDEWAGDWPSIDTVIPSLFDSRINKTTDDLSHYYAGAFENRQADQTIDHASAITDEARRNAAFRDIDTRLGHDIAYIPLDVPQLYFLRGSNIDGYINSLGTSSYPDLATVALKDPSIS